MANIALITGITGQDGSFLAEIFTGKGVRGTRDYPSFLVF